MKVVDQRLRKLLEVRTDSPAMLEALNAVASVHREGGAPLDSEGARRNLRSDIEHRGLDVINDFIARLAPVEDRLLAFNASVEELVASCDRATRRIEQSEADTASFLAQAEALARRRDAVDAQLAEVTEFLTKFELTDDEAAALALGPVEEDGGDAFFRALARVNAIRLQSLSLLTGRDQALGIELLDAATKQQASALDRLFTWTDAQCRDGDALAAVDLGAGGGASSSSSTAPVSPYRMLQRALAVLREQRAPYFRSCQEAAVASRRAAFVRRFLRALSAGTLSSAGGAVPAVATGGGGDAGGNRPIDLHAHDPLRYAGDMLAWVHLNAVEEQETLGGLFGPPLQQPASTPLPTAAADGGGDRAASPTPPSPSSSSSPPPLSLREMLTAVVDGVSRPLCARLEQVLSGGQASLVVTLRLLDVVAFYATTLTPLLTGGTGLLAALGGGVHASAVARFNSLLAAHTARIRSSPPAFPTDLSAAALVVDTAAQLEEVMRVYQASLAAAAEAKLRYADPSAAAGSGGAAAGAASSLIRIDDVLDGILAPLIETCRAGGEGLRVGDTAVYMLNNLAVLAGSLAAFPFTSGWVQRLAAESASWEEALVQQAANDLLAGCGLLSKLTAMRGHDPATAGGLPLASLPTLGPDDLRPVIAGFYGELSSPSLISLFDRVASPRIRSRVRRDTAAVLAAAYARFYADVTAPASGYAAVCDVGALLPRPPEQVELLLDVR